jgi:hypothetical protein
VNGDGIDKLIEVANDEGLGVGYNIAFQTDEDFVL